MKRVAVVIGNGESRLQFDLWQLKNYPVTTYGCNMLFRDFPADFVAAIDQHMQDELRTNYVYTRTILTNSSHSAILLGDDVLCDLSPSIRWDSGRIAIRAAIASGATDIYLLGFDFYSPEDRENNVYKVGNTDRRPEQYEDTWNWLFNKFNVRFVLVGSDENDEFVDLLSNIELQSYAEFIKEIAQDDNGWRH